MVKSDMNEIHVFLLAHEKSNVQFKKKYFLHSCEISQIEYNLLLKNNDTDIVKLYINEIYLLRIRTRKNKDSISKKIFTLL